MSKKATTKPTFLTADDKKRLLRVGLRAMRKLLGSKKGWVRNISLAYLKKKADDRFLVVTFKYKPDARKKLLDLLSPLNNFEPEHDAYEVLHLHGWAYVLGDGEDEAVTLDKDGTGRIWLRATIDSKGYNRLYDDEGGEEE